MEDFLNPSEVLKQLKLQKNMVAADFGSGSGGWTIPLAKILEDGKVYAIDILEEPLSALRSRIKLEKILNIEPLKADIEKTSRLTFESCDLVLMSNLLFQVEDKKKVLEEGKRILKKGGKILIVDWAPTLPRTGAPATREALASRPPDKEKPLIGPPEENRVAPEEVKKMAEELNLRLEKEFEAGLYHWALILVKPRSENLTASGK